MSPLQKLRILAQPSPFANADGWDPSYALSRMLGLRRSRLGVSEAVKRWLVGRVATMEINQPSIKARMAYRVSDYWDLVALQEVFLERIYDFSKVAEVPATILDIGGHIGSFSVLARSHFPETPITIFEPMAGNHALLVRNLAANNVNAVVHNVAVSNFDGPLRMSGCAGIGARLDKDGAESVNVVRLSGMLDLRNAGPLLMKLDVEGAEFDVFDDILDLLPPDVFMFVEVHEGGSAVYRLRHLLEPIGFTVHVPDQGTWKGLAIDCVATRGRFSVA